MRSVLIFIFLAPVCILGQSVSKDTFYTTKEGCKIYSTVANPLFSITWNGQCVNGFAEGNGKRTVYYHDTLIAVFTGTLKNGKREGKGRLFAARDSSVMEGIFGGDTIISGSISYKSGIKVEGDFSGSQVTGKGKIFYPDGRRYEGDLIKNSAEGTGTFWSANGKTKYEGEWKNNMKNGKGKQTDETGTYEGAWANNKRNGYGTQTYKNGDEYYGDFEDDKRNGTGVMKYTNGDSYSGEWKNNVKEGKGVYKFKDGKVNSGNFVKDQFKN